MLGYRFFDKMLFTGNYLPEDNMKFFVRYKGAFSDLCYQYVYSDAFDALSCAGGPIVCLVKLNGITSLQKNISPSRYIGQALSIKRKKDISIILRQFAAELALKFVQDDTPAEITDYLLTLDEELREQIDQLPFTRSLPLRVYRSAAATEPWSAAWFTIKTAAELAAWNKVKPKNWNLQKELACNAISVFPWEIDTPENWFTVLENEKKVLRMLFNERIDQMLSTAVTLEQ